MKYLILIILVIAGYMPVQAQSPSHVKDKIEKVEHIRPGVYKVVYSNPGNIEMKGIVRVRQGKTMRDGIWKVYRHGRRVQTVKYVNGRQAWIKLENGHQMTSQQLQIINLQKKVKELEKQLTQID
jgi:hypothetical protein